jgi:hypothetical protein
MGFQLALSYSALPTKIQYNPSGFGAKSYTGCCSNPVVLHDSIAFAIRQDIDDLVSTL